MRQVSKTFEAKGKATASSILTKWLNRHRNYQVVSQSGTDNNITVVFNVLPIEKKECNCHKKH